MNTPIKSTKTKNPEKKVKVPIEKRKYTRHKPLHTYSSLEAVAGVTPIRLGIFSGITGPLKANFGINQVTFNCHGQNQDHADILDYMMSHHTECFFGQGGRLFLGSVLTDYFNWKNIQPNTYAFKKKAEELQKITINVKNNLCDVSSPIVGLVGYIMRTSSNECNNITSCITKNEILETNKKRKRLLKGEVFYIEIAPLFVQYLALDITLRYPDLLPDIISIKQDVVKGCIRYFLTQTAKKGWIVQANKKTGRSSTRLLCCHIYPDHMQVSKDRRNRRERELLQSKKILSDKFGINYNPTADTWTYTRHKALNYKMAENTENPIILE